MKATIIILISIDNDNGPPMIVSTKRAVDGSGWPRDCLEIEGEAAMAETVNKLYAGASVEDATRLLEDTP